MLENYDFLITLWSRTLDNGVSDTEMKARILGIQAQMSKFDFFFGMSCISYCDVCNSCRGFLSRINNNIIIILIEFGYF